MKLALAFAFLALSPMAAHAESTDAENRIEIHETGKNTLRFTVRYELETKDGCNTFGLTGDLKDRGWEEGMRAMEVDMTVSQTQIFCSDLAQPRRLTLESKTLEITGGQNRVDAVLYVPEGMTIHRK